MATPAASTLDAMLADAQDEYRRADEVCELFRALPQDMRRYALMKIGEIFRGGAVAAVAPVVRQSDSTSVTLAAETRPAVPLRDPTAHAERLVLSNPGMTAAAVGVAIGVSPKRTGLLLRTIARDRGTIEQDGREWFPAKKKTGAAGLESIPDLIRRIMADGVARDVDTMVEEGRRVRPDLKYNSVYAAVKRMDGKSLVEVEQGPRGPLYRQKTEADGTDEADE